MSTHGLEGLDHTVQLTHIWINELDEQLKWNNKARSYRLLKAVLHTLRDSLRVDEAANLGAQLPGLLRGAYYEQWRPATTPVRNRDAEEFLRRVEENFRRDPLAEPLQAVLAVFHLLSKKISEGEIADVRGCLPEAVRVIWPESHGTHGTARH